MKNIRVSYLEILVFGGEIFYIFEQACFRNECRSRSRYLTSTTLCRKIGDIFLFSQGNRR